MPRYLYKKESRGRSEDTGFVREKKKKQLKVAAEGGKVRKSYCALYVRHAIGGCFARPFQPASNPVGNEAEETSVEKNNSIEQIHGNACGDC